MEDLSRFLPARCEHCHCGYTVEDIQQVESRGLRQVTPGEAAVPVTDVTFRCHDCGSSHLVRYTTT